MLIRNFIAGDEAKQAAIYNTAAGALPGFKRATPEEVRRRTSARGFDHGTRFYAEEEGEVVGYCSFEPDSGRISYPWCQPGHTRFAHPLFASVMRAMADRRIPRALAAYRRDWTEQLAYFDDHGFHVEREMVNYSQSIGDLPTMFQRPGLNVSLLKADDLPEIEAMCPGALLLGGGKLADHLLRNPRFATDAIFVLRRMDGSPKGVGVMIDDPSFARVEDINPNAPCFRFGAFGTEGMATKRVNGLFSFLTAPGKEAELIGQDLLWYATSRAETNSFDSLAAQAPSDLPHLTRFFDRYFVRDGSFPILVREVGNATAF